MKEEDEIEVHRKVQKIQGKYEVQTQWGTIAITLDATPNYAGGRGCPDEIATLRAEFAMLGADIQVSVPVLIEAEKTGYGAAREDLDKFCQRSISGEQKSYIEIPMIIVGGDKYKELGSTQRELAARFNMTQVPKRMAI